MQKEGYLIKNACYSVTKYYLCKQNNKRSLLGRKQRSQVARSFLNRCQLSCTNNVTSLFSIRYILIIIFKCIQISIQTKTSAFSTIKNNNKSNNKFLQNSGFVGKNSPKTAFKYTKKRKVK